ncbi:MAG: carbon storage regulator, partial [Myxococcota bacterium]
VSRPRTARGAPPQERAGSFEPDTHYRSKRENPSRITLTPQEGESMLIIRRRIGERIVVGSNIEITVASATRKAVRLAIAAPKGIPILRGEVHDTVVAANIAANASTQDDATAENDAAEAAAAPPSEDPPLETATGT